MTTISIKTGHITVEQRMHASTDRIWKALTDQQQMEQWYFDIAEFKPVVGTEFTFIAGDDKKKYVHYCEVKEVVPLQKLAYTWRYENTLDSLVRFELIPEGKEKTLVRLTHEGLDAFPKDRPELAEENFIQGWTHIIGTSLKEYVEN